MRLYNTEAILSKTIFTSQNQILTHIFWWFKISSSAYPSAHTDRWWEYEGPIDIMLFCDMRIEKCCKLSRCPHVNDEVDFWGEENSGEAICGGLDTTCSTQNSHLLNLFPFRIMHISFHSETMCEVSSINKQRWWKEAIVYQVSAQLHGVMRDRRLIEMETGVSCFVLGFWSWY